VSKAKVVGQPAGSGSARKSGAEEGKVVNENLRANLRAWKGNGCGILFLLISTQNSFHGGSKYNYRLKSPFH